MSTIESAKTACQICEENRLPMSSTYKKIRKLYKAGLISIEKINIDRKGKKVLLYRSRIKSLEFNLKEGGIMLQFHKNDLVRSSTSINATSTEYSLKRCLNNTFSSS
jgi:predicted transcriptional regulator